MAARSGIETLRVLVMSDEEINARVYRFAPTTTVAQVMVVWMADEGTEEEWLARTEGGAALTGAEQLLEVSEGRRTVVLSLERRQVEEAAEETATLSFSIFGESGDVREIAVDLSRTAKEMHAAVRESFGLPEERFFRLLRADEPLSYDLPLSEACLPVAGPIEVDLGYEVEVEDAWSGEVEIHFVYASECLYPLLECTPSHMKRVRLGALLIDSSRCLASALPAHVRQLPALRLIFESQRRLTLRWNGKWKRHQVWPQERLGKVLPVTCDEVCWKYEGQEVEREETFCEIGLQDQAMLLQERPVKVQYSNGEGAVLWLPDLCAVAHLREQLLRKEIDADFSLKVGSRVLKDEDFVPYLSDSSSAVVVVRTENSFVVDVAGKEVKWTSRSGDIRFGQFCYELLENSSLAWKELATAEFRCNGCGRQVRRDEEEFQLLPADCCRVRSLHLSSYTPVEVKDTTVQGQSRSQRSSSMREKKLGHRTPVQRRGCQTEWKGVDATTETSAGLGGSAVCTQHPPPPSLSPFHLLNRTGRGEFQGQWRNVSLLLPSSPTGGQVTTAVAELLGRRPEETEIRRVFDVSRGERVVQAWDGGAFYTTEDGRRRVERKDVEQKTERFSVDDKGAFVLVPGRRLCIDANNRG